MDQGDGFIDQKYIRAVNEKYLKWQQAINTRNGLIKLFNDTHT